MIGGMATFSKSTSHTYSDANGSAMIFNMEEGAQYGCMAGDAGWRLNVIVLCTGDMTST